MDPLSQRNAPESTIALGYAMRYRAIALMGSAPMHIGLSHYSTQAANTLGKTYGGIVGALNREPLGERSGDPKGRRERSEAIPGTKFPQASEASRVAGMQQTYAHVCNGVNDCRFLAAHSAGSPCQYDAIANGLSQNVTALSHCIKSWFLRGPIQGPM